MGFGCLCCHPISCMEAVGATGGDILRGKDEKVPITARGYRMPTVSRGPTIDRAASSGDIWTPQDFRSAVVGKFGMPYADLACSGGNMFASCCGYTPADNSLVQPWHDLPGLLWLNPPFSNITPWAMKCAAEMEQGAEILLLVPGSVGANWYWDWVRPYAEIYSIGRLKFDNCFDRKTGELVTAQYPKDLILCHYDPSWADRSLLPRMQRWRWKEGQ